MDKSPPPQSSPHVLLLNKFLSSPKSLFEHKIFTTLSLLMRNITEHLQDYSGYTYYYSNRNVQQQHQFFNTSLHFLDESDDLIETDNVTGTATSSSLHQLLLSERYLASTLFWLLPLVARLLLSVLCVITATYFVNRRLRIRSVQVLVELVVCHLIVLPFLPFIALFYAGLYGFRGFIYVCNKTIYGGRRHLIAPEDGFWAYEEYASSSMSTALYMIQGTCDIKRITKKVKQVVRHPVTKGKLLRRIVQFCGFAVWEDVDKFDVRQHIKIAKWPKSDKRSGSSAPWSDKDVLDYLTTFQDKPMSCRRPAWEVVVVPNVELDEYPGKPAYCCIYRMHHAIMDGISSANILHEVLADEPFKFTIDPVTDGKRHGALLTFFMYICALLMLPRTGLIHGLMGLDNRHNKYFSPGEMLKGPKHFTWSRPLKMEAVKKIKDMSKTSVMTVLLSGLGGSYRTMELTRRKNRINNNNKCYKKTCNSDNKKMMMMPEFYHALAPVALLPYPDRHPRNGFSGCALPVAVGHHKTPLDRLIHNHKEFKKLGLGTLEILGNFMLISMVGLMPTRLQLLFQRSVHFKMSLSNIPGSDEEIRIFSGDKIVEMGAWLPCKFTLGMAMGLFSYGGRCRATMVGDSTYLSKSDVDSLVRNFETEVLTLGQALGLNEQDIFYS